MTADRLITCVKWGKKFSPDYANKLHKRCEKYAKDADFLCITDNPKGLTCPSTYLWGPYLEGWWNKIKLFKPNKLPKGTRVMNLDLDTVPRGDLSELWEDSGFVGMRSCTHNTPYLNSTMMQWTAGEYDWVWPRFFNSNWHEYFGDGRWLWETCLQGRPEVKLIKVACIKCRQHNKHNSPLLVTHGNPMLEKTVWWKFDLD